MRRKALFLAQFWLLFALFSHFLHAQEAQGSIEHPYRGVQTIVPGVFVTPIAGAPFSAVVDIQTTVILDDGQTAMKKGSAQIARDSAGRIYNERRSLIPVSSKETPELLSAHLFDPQTRRSVFLNPYTHLAREMVLARNPEVPAQSLGPNMKEVSLGEQTMEGIAVRGVIQTKVIAAPVSTTGKSITVEDQYWYSEELHMNMLIKHDDPRSGSQIVSVTHVSRTEPDAKLFEVPAGYKLVDETPVE